jgi:hypothetical protein
MRLEELNILFGIFPTKLLLFKCKYCNLGRLYPIFDVIMPDKLLFSRDNHISDDMLRILDGIDPLRLLCDKLRISS